MGVERADLLARTAIALDKMGFPTSRSRIIGIAEEMLKDAGQPTKPLTLGWQVQRLAVQGAEEV